MIDFLGNKLKVGDEVIIVKYSPGSKQSLHKEAIHKIKQDKIAYIKSWFKGVTSQNIYKV